MSSALSKALHRKLFSPFDLGDASVYAVLDGARDPRISMFLHKSGLEFESLFSGQLTPALRAASPYIVRLDANDELLDILLNEGWGNAWGLYLLSTSNLVAVRRHLQTLLRVRSQSGQYLYFRFYDPRVMRVFLPTCDNEQIRQVFGIVAQFDMEGATSDTLIRFRRTRDVLDGSENEQNALLLTTHPLREAG